MAEQIEEPEALAAFRRPPGDAEADARQQAFDQVGGCGSDLQLVERDEREGALGAGFAQAPLLFLAPQLLFLFALVLLAASPLLLVLLLVSTRALVGIYAVIGVLRLLLVGLLLGPPVLGAGRRQLLLPRVRQPLGGDAGLVIVRRLLGSLRRLGLPSPLPRAGAA